MQYSKLNPAREQPLALLTLTLAPQSASSPSFADPLPLRGLNGLQLL